jgi:hypothetical protein
LLLIPCNSICWSVSSATKLQLPYKRASGVSNIIAYFRSIFSMLDMLRAYSVILTAMLSVLLIYTPGLAASIVLGFVSSRKHLHYELYDINEPIDFKKVIYPALAFAIAESLLNFSLKLSHWYCTKKCSTFLSKFVHIKTPFLLMWIARRFILDRIQDVNLFFWCHVLLIAVTIIMFSPFFKDIVRTVKYRQRRKKFNLKHNFCNSNVGLFIVSMISITLILWFFIDLLFANDVSWLMTFPFLFINYPVIIYLGWLIANFEHSEIKVMYEIQYPREQYVLVKHSVCGNARFCHNYELENAVSVLYNSTSVPPATNLYVPDYTAKVVEFSNIPVWIRQKIRQNALTAA